MPNDLHPRHAHQGSRLRGMVRRLGSAASATLESRPAEVRPPALWGGLHGSMWSGLLGWLRETHRTEPEPVRTIDMARIDFQLAMADLESTDANGLRQRVASARSLRELWHLRTALYGLIACHVSQVEAERRVAQVNRHFPVGTQGNMSTDRKSHHG
jgi:hypothetical protein